MTGIFDGTLAAVQEWSRQRGLDGASPAHQMLKLTEEVGELAAAIARNKKDAAEDAIGDTLVVLTILCQQLGTSLTDCYDAAYHVIKNRQGKTVNGVFVKASDLEGK